MKRKYIKSIAFGLALSCAIPAMAQNEHTYTGRVVDGHGDPVIGATVRVPGTSIATVTDLDGNYRLVAPSGRNLTVSYIGYKDMPTEGGTVKLIDADTDLNEVVVVGYGQQKKAHLTGSVETIATEDISDLANGGLASTLSGLVNGMSISGGDGRPGENATISIRGVNSLAAIGSTAQQPLFVIDGYIYPNDIKIGNNTENLGAQAFNNLDASEIENISVLKDASAAVYGARGANGVILVTTKKGQLGAPRISYNGSFGFTDAVATPKMLNSYEYGRLWNAVQAADPTNTSLNHTTDLFQADELEAMKNLNYNLLDKYWKTGVTQKHGVNISGASERASYFAGVSYFDQDGNLGKLDYNRWNYRAGVDVKISKWLGAGLTVSGDYGKKTTPNVKVGGSSAEKQYNLILTHPTYVPEYIGDNGEYGVINTGTSNNFKINQNQNYNYSVLQNNGDYSKNMTSNLNLSGNLSYDFGWSKVLKGLKLRFNYSKSINNTKTNEYGTQYTLYSMSRRYGSGSHLFTPVSADDENLYTENNLVASTVDNGNYLARTTTRTDNYQINFTVQYAREFGKHSVQALYSVEKSKAESEYLTGSVTNPYEFTTGQSNSTNDGTQTTVFTRAETADLSYIGRLNYAYADKYLLELLLRADASQKFAPENKWGYFPAVSAGYVVSEEKWFREALPWWDFMKLRASWGMTGRDNTTAFQWMQVYNLDKNRGTVFGNYTTDSSNRITINKNTSAVNREITWDKSNKLNIGLDSRFLNQRLSVTFDAYLENNTDILLRKTANIASTIGTQTASLNYGKIRNWGYELSLNWHDKIGKDFKYKIGLNTGYSDNKVLAMDWATDYLYRQIGYGDRTDNGLWGMQCLGMFRTYEQIDEYFAKNNITSYMGYSKDQVKPGMLIYKDVRGAQQADGTYAGPDGIVDAENDQVELGHRNNIYGFTMNLGAEYKGLSLNAQFNANWGGYTCIQGAAISGSNLEYTNMPSFWNVDNMYSYQDVYDGSANLVVAANRNALYPNLKYYSVNSVASSFWRVSAARVALNRLTLAYSIPKLWLTKLGIGVQSFRINVTGQNLINFYNPYPDSFYSAYAGNYGSYPNLRKWTVGVNVTF